jgi:TetR/AcrR family transcriptional regulator, cholesterol catabolism regulator
MHNTGVAKLEIGREEQILREALRLFSQSGYHGTSLQEIADELGITRPAFYYYFNSKDELLWRLIGNLGDHLLEEARPIAATKASPRDKLRNLLITHTRTILGNRDAFKIYFTERHLVGTRRDRQLRRGEEQYHRLFEKVIRDGQLEGTFREDNANVLSLLVTGLANSALQWFQPRKDLSLEAVSELVADLGLAAIAPVPAARRRAPAEPGNARRLSSASRA